MAGLFEVFSLNVIHLLRFPLWPPSQRVDWFWLSSTLKLDGLGRACQSLQEETALTVRGRPLQYAEALAEANLMSFLRKHHLVWLGSLGWDPACQPTEGCVCTLMGLLEPGWKWKRAGHSLLDAQLRRQVQKQISHVLFNALLVARPSLLGSWGVVGGWGQSAPLA